MKKSDTIGLWPSKPGNPSLSLQTPGAREDAAQKAAAAGRRKRSETERRLIKVDGKVQVLADVAAALAVPPAQLAAWYDRGLRTMEALTASRDRALAKRPKP